MRVGRGEEQHAGKPALLSSPASGWSPLPHTPPTCQSRGGHFREPRVAVGSVSTHSPERVAAGRKSTFQTFGKEVCLIDHSMCPVPSTVREPICCECQARCGGCLPVPRVEAALPYWVPLSLRPRKKVVKRQQSFKGVQDSPLDFRSWYHRWRICCNGSLFFKWRKLQAHHHQEPPALGRGASPPVPFLPVGLSFLTLLQAVVRVAVAIRQLFWV
ncbi:uncharacterized protein C16orf95 homolog isoform X2 [Hyaena hyaena]|uniref:uncharacterized protein C16orf95 homolog isoform X2 n=1 Tax=Hyaena hyaena TaxID=95912 RepID=UPI001922B337|nr:uncharacterized protein C16orf95 homolog isoform X2 [Hyaena hyaena]